MLRIFRTGAQSNIFKFLVFGLILGGTLVGVALFGVQDLFRHGSRTETVATIGRDKILKSDLDNMLLETLRAQRMTRDEAYRKGLPLVTLQREVNSRLFIRAASDMGIIVDDATVRRKIDALTEPMREKGVTEKAALDEILYTYGVSEGRLVATLKAEIAVENLSHALSDGASAPRDMVNDFMQYRNEWRRGDYIKLTAADADVKDPTNDELKEFYTSELQTHYMQPELRSFSVLVIDAAAVGGAKPDTDAKAFYDAHKTQFVQPERRLVSEVSTDDEALAQKIASRAKSPEDMKALAAEAGKNKATYTSDTYTVENFLPEELAADVFKAAAGKVLPPKKGLMGRLVVARVDKIIPASTMSFEEAKPVIEKELAEKNAAAANSEALFNRAGEIDEMIGGGKSLSDVAQHYNLKTVEFKDVDAQGNDANGKKVDAHGVPDFEKVLKTASATEKGVASQPMQTDKGEGAFFVVEVHDVKAAQAKPFNAVRADVLQAWKQKEAGGALDAKAAKVMERLKMGQTLQSVADSLHKTVLKTPLLQRETQPDKKNPLEPGLMLALFSIDNIGQATTVPGPGSVTILTLAERKMDASKPPTQEEQESMKAMLSQALQADLLEEFRRSLMAKYDARIDEQQLKAMYTPQDSGEEEETTQ